MPQVYFVRTAAQAMQSNQHWLGIHRSDLFKLSIVVVCGPRRQAFISTLIRVYGEIDSKGPCELGLFGGKQAPFVVYRDILAFNCCPESLEVAVKEQRIEATDWSHMFAEIEEVRRLLPCLCILRREGKWGVVVVEGGFGIAKQTPEVHYC